MAPGCRQAVGVARARVGDVVSGHDQCQINTCAGDSSSNGLGHSQGSGGTARRVRVQLPADSRHSPPSIAILARRARVVFAWGRRDLGGLRMLWCRNGYGTVEEKGC